VQTNKIIIHPTAVIGVKLRETSYCIFICLSKKNSIFILSLTPIVFHFLLFKSLQPHTTMWIPCVSLPPSFPPNLSLFCPHFCLAGQKFAPPLPPPSTFPVGGLLTSSSHAAAIEPAAPGHQRLLRPMFSSHGTETLLCCAADSEQQRRKLRCRLGC
jgi:hypothetical protein